MSIRVRTTPRDLTTLSGRLPACLAAAVIGLGLPSALYAQTSPPPGAEAAPAAPPAAGVRDPLKPGKDGDKPIVKVSEHNTVDLHVKDEDLANVLQLLSIQTQKNIIASKNVSARVTATLYGVTFYEALDAILHVNGFGYLEKGNFLYVYTNEELKQIEAALKKRVARVVKLNYLNAIDAKTFAEPLLSRDGGQIQTAEKTAAFNIPEKAPVGKDDFALSATLVVIDYEENIAAIEELLKQLDTRPAQVLIEATILQTSLTEANAFGIDFSIIGDLKFNDFINIGGPLGVANGLIRGGTGASGSGLSPSDNQGTGVVSNPGNTGGPGTFKVGVVAGDLSVFLRMLDTVTDTVILSNPKILTLNRQPARVLVGTRVGYLSTTSTETSTTQTVEFLDTGTQLYFRPFVSSEGDIRMELKPQVSAAEIREVTDSSGATVTIPDEATQELVTNVNVRDGQTIVLGGLFTENQTFNRRQVPFLGDIPIVGSAFRGNDDNTDRSEIIFLVTPTIVSDQSIASSAEKAQGDMERLRAGTRQGLLPWSREKMTSQLNVEAEKLAREGNFDRSLWLIQRSLSLNAHQPSVYRLRERITGERERWPDPNRLNNIYHDDATQRLGEIQPPADAGEHRKPWGSVNQPRERVTNPGSVSYNSNSSDPTTQALLATNAADLQRQFAIAVAPASELAVDSNDPAALIGIKGTPLVKPESTSSLAASPSDPRAPSVQFNETNNPSLVQGQLGELRAFVLGFIADNQGSMPALGVGEHQGWDPMVSNGFLPAAPTNPYVGGVNSSRIVIGFKPDRKFHSDYGWIFNPETGELWAAGFDGSDKPLPNTLPTTANTTSPQTVVSQPSLNASNDPSSSTASGDQPEAGQTQSSVIVEDMAGE